MEAPYVLKADKKCRECESMLRGGSYFKCDSCPNHYLCSSCFWKENNFDD